MNTLLYAKDFTTWTLTIILHIYFLYRTLNTKIYFKKQVIITAIFIIARLAYYYLNLPFRPYFSVVACIIYASFMFKGKYIDYILWSITAIILDGMVDLTILGLYIALTNINLIGFGSYKGINLFYIVVVKLMVFLVYYFITKKVDKDNSVKPNEAALIIIFPLGSLILINYIHLYKSELYFRDNSPVFFLTGIVLLIMSSSTIALYNSITKTGKELANQKVQLHTTNMTQEHINQVNEMYAKLSSVRHDLYNHFSVIIGYVKLKEYEKLEAYMTKFTNVNIKIYEYVNQPVLNTLISSAHTRANAANVDFTTDLPLPEIMPLTDVDLCILVSNILDNAFESNKLVSENKFIDLTMTLEKSYWIIVCRNSTSKQANYKTTKAIKSTKDDYSMHGIGTKQIQDVAERSGGYVSYRHEGYIFSTVVTIKLQ